MSGAQIFERAITIIGLVFVVGNAVAVFRLWRRYG